MVFVLRVTHHCHCCSSSHFCFWAQLKIDFCQLGHRSTRGGLRTENGIVVADMDGDRCINNRFMSQFLASFGIGIRFEFRICDLDLDLGGFCGCGCG
jgi:hypothetical protein